MDFQFRVDKRGKEILGKLSGSDDTGSGTNKEKNPKAPFNTMTNANLFAFMLGLFYGKREPIGDGDGNWNFGSIQRAANKDGQFYDFETLLVNFGKTDHTWSTNEAMTAVMEYINWGLIQMSSQEYGENDFRFGDYLKQITGEEE